MIFAPHKLQKKVVTPMQEDEYGRLIPGTDDEMWKDVGLCRCDDVSADKKASVNGAVYDYKFKVVYDSSESITAGTYVRCLNADGSIRGEGIARNPMQTSYLHYKTIWLE